MVLAALIGLPVVASVLVVALGITISAAPWRDSIAAAASHAIGRQVRLEGQLELVPTLRPLLTIGGVHIANPPGFSQPEFASLGKARLQIDLRAALSRRLVVHELSASEVSARLEVTADGRVNWLFELPQPPPGQQVRREGVQPTIRPEDVRFDVKQVELQKLSVEYFDATTQTSRFFDLDELTGEAPADAPVKVSLRGAVERTFPYVVSFTGGRAMDLLRGAQPWPYELNVDFLGTVIRMSGAIEARGSRGSLVFGMGTEDLSQVERLLQTQLPKVGATGLAANVKWEPGKVEIAPINGVMGKTTLVGKLHADNTGGRPKLSGQLFLPQLDMRPFLQDGAPEIEARAPPRDLADTYRELEQVTFSLRALNLMDLELDLGVGQWLSLPGEVREAKLAILLQNGVLRAPVQGSVTGVRLAGELAVDGAADVPSFQLALGSERTALGGLAEVLLGLRGIRGDVGRLNLNFVARGENVAQLVRSLDVHIQLARSRLSYTNVEDGRPIDFTLERFDVAIPSARPLRGTMRGTLLEEPFSAQLSGGDLPSVMRELRTPFKLAAKGAGATVRLEGTLAKPQASTGTDLAFSVTGRRAGDLHRWLGISPTANAAIAIEGHARVQSDEWRLSDLLFRLGRTAMTGALARTGIGGRQPLVTARLDVENLDVEELQTLLPASPPEAARRKEVEARSTAATLDIPILPAGIDLTDADVDVTVNRVHLKATDVTDASFNGRIRDGKMSASPFGAKVAGVPFSGAVALDLRGKLPEASLWIAANDVDVGKLLRDFKVVKELDAQVDSLRVQLIGRGSRLGDMLEKSALEVNVDGGAFRLRNVQGKPLVAVALKQGVASAQPGQPVSLRLDGGIDEIPVEITISSGTLIDFLRVRDYVPFALAAKAAGAQLELNGRVSLPIAQRAGELRLTVQGARLNSLNKLARVELPPWGPWSFGGSFKASQKGYAVPDLNVRVGSSSLDGRGTLDVTGVRPRLDVDLRAPRVQLDDFKLDGWSPFEKKETAPKEDEKKITAEELRAKAKAGAAQAQKLLSRETLLRADGYVDVAVDQVLSGADVLGSGKLHAQLENARMEFGPATVNVPGGSANLKFAYEPTETDVVVGANIQVERFDYGILARRIQPDTDLRGTFSLSFRIDSRAPTLAQVMSNANGRIDFAVWPQNMRAGIFDLWAVNLFIALVPAVDPAQESKVNCAIGRFDVRNGKLSQDAVFMDTSRMRVSGAAQVNFGTERLQLLLVPKPKRPQFFSLATPVQVSGSLTDPQIGVAPGGVAETLARQVFSIVLVPIQKLTERDIPRDGADVCANAMRAELPQ